jgi:hypothetical protein
MGRPKWREPVGRVPMGGLVAALEYAVASGDGGVLAFRTMASPIPVPARDPPSVRRSNTWKVRSS